MQKENNGSRQVGITGIDKKKNNNKKKYIYTLNTICIGQPFFFKVVLQG